MVAYAREKLAAVAARAPGPVLDLELRLSHHSDPARERPNHVEASLNLDGQPLRAHRSAETMTEAIDRATTRLRRQIEAHAERPQSKQLRHRDPTSWHHEDRVSQRPSYYPRPLDERDLVRRKTFSVGPESIEEALFDLEALDQDFFLFVNDETDEENVVYRVDGEYGLMQSTPTPDAIGRIGVDHLHIGPRPAAMRDRDAREILDQSEAPFIFYIDVDTGRGRLFYRRYDGHYGQITTA
jgi:ribosome-associated translation inhibitor RaiA